MLCQGEIRLSIENGGSIVSCTLLFYSSCYVFSTIIPIYTNARIGLASEGLKNTIEKALVGAGVVLSSPRFVIPIVIFGLSAFSDHFQNNTFSF